MTKRAVLGVAPNVKSFATGYGLNGGIRKRQNEQERGNFDTSAPKGAQVATSNHKLPRVCLVAAEETSPSVLYGLYDVLSTAGAVYSELTSGKPGEKALDVRIVAATDRPFRCFGGVMVEPHDSIEQVDETNAAIICDMYTPIDTPPRGRYGREIEWLKQMYANGAILGSVCSGSLVLAEAGLLDGQEAAGHWAYRDLFRDQYPKVTYRMDSILRFGGERDRIITAGGVTSWQDLALYLIARLCGPQDAIRTAKIHILSDHSDGQLPFAVLTPRVQRTDAVIGACQSWIAENLACENPVASMTAHSGLNPRTFARRFLAATGYHPVDYVHALRIEEAKRLLEADPVNVEEIGHIVGYEDPTFFRRLFKRKVGLTPAAYRRKFSKIVAIGAR
jgi:transcriptional regulator GlxA family with amidase domain